MKKTELLVFSDNSGMNRLLRLLPSFFHLKLDDELEEEFKLELAKTELLRVNLLIGTIVLGFIGGVLNFFLLQEEGVFSILIAAMGNLWFMVVSIIVYEVSSRSYLVSRIRKKKTIPGLYRVINLLVETSFPTLIIIMFALKVNNLVIYFSPFILLYFLFIVLATLHLDFRLSALTGLVAGIEYFFVSHFLIENVPVPEDVVVLLESDTLIMARVVLIILCGIASGFVAVEIRKRIANTFKAIGDRNRIREVLGQQVSHEIVDQIMKEGKEISTNKLNVCVMFLDVRDFTPFASTKLPEEVLDYQNKLFGNLIEIINRNRGIVNQILGDGFMATFGAPFSQGNDCLNAMTAAEEILISTAQLNESGIIPPTRLGIGIHYGEAITGNIGSELRKQYSIVGNVVIQASRIEQLNKQYQSQLLISKQVFEKAGMEPTKQNL